MSKLRLISTKDAIDAIDAAVRAGSRITSVEVSPDGNAVVRFVSVVRVPRSPLDQPFTRPSYENSTVEFWCGLAAAEHARELMRASDHLSVVT